MIVFPDSKINIPGMQAIGGALIRVHNLSNGNDSRCNFMKLDPFVL